MIKEPMFISPRTFRDYEQYKTDCARASGWNEAMAFIFAEELETERSRTIREKFFVVENVQTERSEQMKCDFCGREFEPNEDDLLFEFITKNGESVKACEDCIIRKGKDVERKVAEKNVN